MNLGYTPREVTLTISNPAPEHGDGDRGSGYGLAGMRERLQLTGGTLTAGRAGGQWTVRAQVPL
jgi:signal transduction histidine kinase